MRALRGSIPLVKLGDHENDLVEDIDRFRRTVLLFLVFCKPLFDDVFVHRFLVFSGQLVPESGLLGSSWLGVLQRVLNKFWSVTYDFAHCSLFDGILK